MFFRISLTAVLLTLTTLLPAYAADSASVIMYHRFGETDYPATNISIEQFEAHLEELKTGGYTVMALGDIVKALREGGDLPNKAVAITIDDAYLSVYTHAWPRLKDAGFPFTLFVSTQAVDRGYVQYLNWDQIREMVDGGMTVGHHTASHLHMADATDAIVVAEIQTAASRYQAELGAVPEIFAYPYGEFSSANQDALKAAGIKAAFGQHSGAFGLGEDLYGLPRFSMSEAYGDIARFRTAAGAQPVPTNDMEPVDSKITTNNPPSFGFTVDDSVTGLERLACYSSREGRLSLELIGPRVEVRMSDPLPAGRTRINCTMPGDDGRWRWLGRMLTVAE